MAADAPRCVEYETAIGVLRIIVNVFSGAPGIHIHYVYPLPVLELITITV